MPCILSVPAGWARTHLAEINPYTTASIEAPKQSQSAISALIRSSSRTPSTNGRPAPGQPEYRRAKRFPARSETGSVGSRISLCFSLHFGHLGR
jgi:hypothetical protein